MTTRSAGQPPTPEQIAAGGPPPSIDIIEERRIPTQPTPGETRDMVAITYRIPPSPYQVMFVPLEDLPDWVYRRDNPGKEVPEDIQKKGDEALRQRIRRQQRPIQVQPRRI